MNERITFKEFMTKMAKPTESELFEAIDALKSFDLKTVPFERIKEKTTVLIRCGFFGASIPQHYEPVYRARQTILKKLFTNVSEITYPPEKYLVELNRASSVAHQIFYGAVTPQIKDIQQVTSLIEVGEITDGDDETEEITTIGQWFINQEISPIAIVGIHSKLSDNNSHAIAMRKIFAEQKSKHPEAELLAIADKFIGDQFEKRVPKAEPWKYKITAAYGDGLFENGVDAITYPSVKGEGRAFNIAIHKDAVDRTMTIRVAGVTRLRRVKKEVFIDWLKGCEKIEADGTLRWVDPPASATISDEQFKILRDQALRKG